MAQITPHKVLIVCFLLPIEKEKKEKNCKEKKFLNKKKKKKKKKSFGMSYDAGHFLCSTRREVKKNKLEREKERKSVRWFIAWLEIDYGGERAETFTKK